MGRFFLKWLGGAILAAIFGYLVLGPRLAGDRQFETLVKKVAPTIGSEPKPVEEEPVDQETPPEKPRDAPKVKVGVTPVDESPPRRR